MSVRLTFARAFTLFFIAFLAATSARAEPPVDCSTPRSATDSVFAWLQPERYQPDMAARCLDPSEHTPEELVELAKRIKAVYDARALFIDVPSLSDDPAWVNPATQKARFAPDKRLPEVVIERQDDGAWRWTRPSLDQIDRLYEESLTRSFVDELPPSLRGKIFGVEVWQYLSLLLIVLLGLFVRKLIELVLKARLPKIAKRLGTSRAAAIVQVVASPGATLVMAAMLAVTYPEIGLPIGASLVMSVAVRMLIVSAIVLAAYRLVDLISAGMAEKAAGTNTKLDDQLVPLIRRSLKVFVVVGGGLFILQNLDVDVGSLLAGLGIGGLAFALAAKDTIANFFGSVMIFADRPFQIGDWIVIEGAEGIVEEVGFRSTRVRAFDNALITVPNASFTESKINNYGARVYRRCFVTLNLTYATTPEQMQAFVEGVRAVIQANEHTRKDTYEVHMSGFGASSLDVMVYFFFKVATWSDELREKHNVFLEIMRLARDVGVDFAFPTQTLHVEGLAPSEGAPAAAAPESDALAKVVYAFGPGGARARPAGPKITDTGFVPQGASGSGDDGA